MIVEELLKPRYEVIADYPDSIYKVGDIVGDYSYPIIKSHFPAIFRPLAWYEKRNVGEMPEYVKMIIDCRIPLGTILKSNWRFFTSTEDIAHYNERPEYWIDAKFFLPATEQEYLTHINTKP